MGSFRRHKIRQQKTVGQRLLLARRRKKLTLEAVEEATRIRARYIEAIEKDDYRKLPSQVYLVGFLSSYAELVDLPAEEIIKQYKKERGRPKESGSPATIKPIDEIGRHRFAITPKTLVWTVAIAAVLMLFGYIGWQVKKFSSPPPIEIVSPASDTVTSDSITLKGITSDTAEVSINGHSVVVSSDGKFKQLISLKRGVNSIEIKAKNRIGKESVKILKIFADFKI